MNYKINYTLLKNDFAVKNGIIIVKNSSDKIEAKYKLHRYLRKTKDFDTLKITRYKEVKQNKIIDYFNNNIFK